MPAAAVIPSLIAFSYVVAVKKLVAFSSLTACDFEKIGVFIAELSLYSTAKNHIVFARTYGVYGSVELGVFDGDR